jgi:hypothetical protein
MKYMKWVGLFAATTLIVACFLPWVVIESRNITVTGTETTGTRFGKPAYFHFAMTVFFLFFTLVSRVWAKRANLLIVALNLGWAIRNFFVITACQGGECPVKQIGIWLVLVSSVLMLISALFPDMEVREENPDGQDS